ncbi:uncharacterized protein LOC124156894 [Ischnura elegans]|uniref:uncharacterized protein LOC124156894 n=1 Tax=Ischnura elegans TaxID=197161 RepID=UPI001ED89F53|nr:uncharacterized protein LOC124156894 [Ischnura elegans]
MDVEEAALIYAAANILAVVAEEEGRHRRNRRRKIWCRDWLRRREDGDLGILGMVEHELRVEDLSAYNNFLRLNTIKFNELLSLVEDRISKLDTFMRPSLSAGRKLMTTLRFLATGESFRSLMYSCRIHETTISRFIPEVCNAIYCALRPYIQVPSTEAEWETISEDSLKLWQVPNCIGAVDGKRELQSSKEHGQLLLQLQESPQHINLWQTKHFL